MCKQKTVAVAMSGGVDSSVSALLLKKLGFRVFGIFMKNWKDDGQCSSAEDYNYIVEVCEKLNIAHYTVNFEKQYFDKVFRVFLDEIKDGKIPNPDVLCNKKIKFDLLLKKAIKLGADFLATGHYCRIKDNKLLKGIDLNKDQSYFLHKIDEKILSKIIFPIGEKTKQEVRSIAKENNLSNFNKKDSTGICFIGKRNFKEFLKQYIKSNSGFIKNRFGEILGKHDGVNFYTIGQRKGLNIGGKGPAYFVVDKDIKNNILIVEQGESEDLYKKNIIAKDVHFINKHLVNGIEFPFTCNAKIRYRQKDERCTVEKIDDNNFKIVFFEKQKAISYGQSIVFYKKDVCLGGGIITKSY